MACLQAIKHCFPFRCFAGSFQEVEGGLQSSYFSSPNHDKLSTWFSIPNGFYLSSHPFPSAGAISFRLLIAMCFRPRMVKDGTKDSPSRWHKFPRCHSKIHGRSSLSLSTPTMGEMCSCHSPQATKWNSPFYQVGQPCTDTKETQTSPSRQPVGRTSRVLKWKCHPWGSWPSHRHTMRFSPGWRDEARF